MSGHYSYKIEELQEELRALDAEIERLKELCARAADALDVTNWKLIQPEGQLITELRKADPMNDDTSFETHRQQILQLGRIIVEQYAEIERLKTVLKNAVEIFEMEVPQGNPTIEEMRKAAE